MSGNFDTGAYEAEIATADNAAAQAGTVATANDAGRMPIWWSAQNAMTISAAVLLFGAVVIAIAARNTPQDTPLEAKLRLYGTVMVITMAAFLVVAGYDDNQIAAPLGLLGTIAGYLLGQRAMPDKPAEPGVRSQPSANDETDT